MLLGGSDQRSSGKRKSSFGGFENLAFSQHGQSKITAKKKIVVYIQSSDVFKGFDSWVAAMTFIQDEKQKDDTVRWWLDALEPPTFEMCVTGTKTKTSDGKPRYIPSIIDLTGCEASAVKILCPWSLVRAWEREDHGKVDVEVFNTKTPRDQFSISDSFGVEIMLASFNMPIVMPAKSKSAEEAVHPVLAEPAIEEKLRIGPSAVEADRTLDMPFIILRGEGFVVTYGWAPNRLSMKIRHEFVNVRAHAHAVGKSMADSALDEVFAKAFEISIAEIEYLVESSTSTSDKLDDDRKKFTTDEIREEGDQSPAKKFLHTVADNIALCNRLLRSLLPKKAVCTAVDQVEWPDYIGKSCRQRLESCVAVFQYLEEQASSNLEQLKSMQDSCLSMINLGLSSQGMDMNMIMQRFAVVTLIMAPLTLITGFFGMNVPIPGPSMNPDEHERCACWLCLWPARPCFDLTISYSHTAGDSKRQSLYFAILFLLLNPFLQQLCLVLVHSRVRFCFYCLCI